MVIERVETDLLSSFPDFGQRRLQVLQACADGVGGRNEIAAHLNLAPDTVKGHRAEAMERYRCDFSGEVRIGTVIAAAVRSGVIEAPAIADGLVIREPLKRFVPGLLMGKTNKQIADEVCLAPGTVKNYVGELMRGLGAKNRNHAIAILAAMEKKEENAE